MAQVMVNFRMDESVKKSMEQACREMGLSMTTAFTIFATKVGREKRIPFEVTAEPCGPASPWPSRREEPRGGKPFGQAEHCEDRGNDDSRRYGQFQRLRQKGPIHGEGRQIRYHGPRHADRHRQQHGGVLPRHHLPYAYRHGPLIAPPARLLLLLQGRQVQNPQHHIQGEGEQHPGVNAALEPKHGQDSPQHRQDHFVEPLEKQAQVLVNHSSHDASPLI